MADRTYIYRGPPSGVSLRLPDGTTRDVILHTDRRVRLPADHPVVERMVGRHHLEECPCGRPKGAAEADAAAAATAPASDPAPEPASTPAPRRRTRGQTQED